MKIRIKFAKYGAMKFIGHLDVMRFFQKAIRRAAIDIKYSEGFSPHQIMSFASPLGVGMESIGEYLDIEVNSMTSTEEMKASLNEVMVEGISVLSVNILPDTAKNAMASVAAAEYLAVYIAGLPIDNFEQNLAEFNKKEHITVTKTTKKSTTEQDIKPGIFKLNADKGINLPGKDINDKSAVYMLLDASSGGNIKPLTVLEEFCKFCHRDFVRYDWQLIRLETYTKSEDGLIPLFKAGE